MSFLARFPGTSIDDDRRETRESLQDRMAAAHARIKATMERLDEEAWYGIAMPDQADELDVQYAEERATRMERNVVFRAGWSAAT